ncbi:MAG: hypothetical protein ABS68_12865 [Niastella sp. SCN 39-18]|nr:MAG: hypothetical protein ABS68_12865 [Niastella sp. SCN 39-18]OJW08219.1 MAG: hypothetical protein BGO53_05075 [Sphingobacteriales bacterium 39-19]
MDFIFSLKISISISIMYYLMQIYLKIRDKIIFLYIDNQQVKKKLKFIWLEIKKISIFIMSYIIH